MIQRGAHWIVLTAGHCSCANDAWRATSMWLEAARANAGLAERTCEKVANYYEGNRSVDGMVLDCGAPTGLVQPLALAAQDPRTEERLVYTGYTRSSSKHVLNVTSRSLPVYLHTVSAKAASSFIDPTMTALSRSVLLANGREEVLSTGKHDAYTKAGSVTHEGMSGGPVLNTNCELVGVLRGIGNQCQQTGRLRAGTGGAGGVRPGVTLTAIDCACCTCLKAIVCGIDCLDTHRPSACLPPTA